MASKKLFDYQQLQTELNQLLESLQSGEMDIDDAIKAYKHGQEIIVQLSDYLKTAQNTVTKLTKDFSN